MIRTMLAAMLLLCPAMARAEWHEAASDHFIVYSDDRREDVARFAERLERFDRTLRLVTNMPAAPISPANRVTVYVVADRTAVARLAGSDYVAGFYVPRASGSIAIVPRASGGSEYDIDEEQVLFHEYTHHFMLSNWAEAAFPPWFVEGFAEFFGPTRLRPDGSIEVARTPPYRRYALSDGLLVTTATLLTADLDKLDVSAIYAQGWLLTHLLLTDPARQGQLERFMAAIDAGKPRAQAAEAFGDLRQLDRDLRVHLRGGLKYRIIPPGTIARAAVTVRALRPGEAAMMPIRIRSKRGVDATTAKALVPVARRAAAPYPNDPAVQVVLAEVAFDASDYPAAEAAARRAVAADPRSTDGHLYIGLARMAAARAAENRNAALWRDIRRAFLAANAVENDDPEPLMYFYQSFLDAGQPLTPNARDALLRAQSLAPQDRTLRMQTAMMLLEADRAADARRMLGPVAYTPHRDEMATLAGDVIRTIDGEGPAAALAKWRKANEKPPAKPST